MTFDMQLPRGDASRPRSRSRLTLPAFRRERRATLFISILGSRSNRWVSWLPRKAQSGLLSAAAKGKIEGGLAMEKFQNKLGKAPLNFFGLWYWRRKCDAGSSAAGRRKVRLSARVGYVPATPASWPLTCGPDARDVQLALQAWES